MRSGSSIPQASPGSKDADSAQSQNILRKLSAIGEADNEAEEPSSQAPAFGEGLDQVNVPSEAALMNPGRLACQNH